VLPEAEKFRAGGWSFQPFIAITIARPGINARRCLASSRIWVQRTPHIRGIGHVSGQGRVFILKDKHPLHNTLVIFHDASYFRRPQQAVSSQKAPYQQRDNANADGCLKKRKSRRVP
jgi:hypothetical protein